MFVCACGKQSKRGEKPQRVVVKTRPVEYHNQFRDEEGRVEMVVSRGSEIVKEEVRGECCRREGAVESVGEEK